MDLKKLEHKLLSSMPSIGDSEDFQNLINASMECAKIIDIVCPDGREKSMALSKLEDVAHWANASIVSKTISKETLKEIGVCKGCKVPPSGCGATGGWDLEGFPITSSGVRWPCRNRI